MKIQKNGRLEEWQRNTKPLGVSRKSMQLSLGLYQPTTMGQIPFPDNIVCKTRNLEDKKGAPSQSPRADYLACLELDWSMTDTFDLLG